MRFQPESGYGSVLIIHIVETGLRPVSVFEYVETGLRPVSTRYYLNSHNVHHLTNYWDYFLYSFVFDLIHCRNV